MKPRDGRRRSMPVKPATAERCLALGQVQVTILVGFPTAQGQIRTQFLAEAVMLALAGGTAGEIAGAAPAAVSGCQPAPATLSRRGRVPGPSVAWRPRRPG